MIYTGGQIFDGFTLQDGMATRIEDGVFVDFIRQEDIAGSDVIDLNGDILSPGYVDLQVNGGDGVMLNDDPSVETLTRMARAHRRLGVARILPTLITDTADTTQAAIEAVIACDLPEIAGLHLEGPHLSIARKGAHDSKYIRPMSADDLQMLLDTKADLPVLKITVAPENVTEDQVAQLANAGVLVSLGHTDADFDTCMRYANAGARCVTHLFNAMSQIGNRAPGVVGAALSNGSLSTGLIADGIHVHPATMQIAWAAKSGPGGIFLVSDAMAVAGTDLQEFHLDGRLITRRDGQLRLSDGTLAGADLDLTSAVHLLVNQVGIPLETALRAATSGPAKLAGIPAGRLAPNSTQETDIIRISSDLSSVHSL